MPKDHVVDYLSKFALDENSTLEDLYRAYRDKLGNNNISKEDIERVPFFKEPYRIFLV